MLEQIQAELGNYVGWNVYALGLILVAARWPKVARGIFSTLFLGAGVWNLFASLTMPAFYVSTYGPVATPPYAAFITRPFAANPALFVVPIAIGQVAIGILAAGTGPSVRLAMVGSTVFLLAIAPMGVGAAFPFSVFVIVAAYLVFREPFRSSMFADIGAAWVSIARAFQPRRHA
jgi:hypothetical protein